MPAKMGFIIETIPIPRDTYSHISNFAQGERWHAVIRVGELSRASLGITSDAIRNAIAAGKLHSHQITGNVFFDIHHDQRTVHFSNYEPILPRLKSVLGNKGIGTRVDIFLFQWLARRNPAYVNYSISTGSGASKERLGQLQKRGREAEKERTIAGELRAALQQARVNHQKNKPKKSFLRRTVSKIKSFRSRLRRRK